MMGRIWVISDAQSNTESKADWGATGCCAQWAPHLSTEGLHVGLSWEDGWVEHLGEQMGRRSGCWGQ